MTAREWLRYAQKKLESEGIADADSDAFILLSHVTGMSRMAYSLERNRELGSDETERLEEALQRRSAHIPVQQITGEAWFMGYPFRVNEHVLIPRMDTETLVETVLERLPSVPEGKDGTRKVLDLCTGSGCILLSLLKEAPMLSGTGADVSLPALKVARANGEKLGIQARFVQSDLWENIEGEFEIIVSNPPYIARQVIPTLDAEVKDHEPVLALDGGEDGLDFYRRIIAKAYLHLAPAGLLAFEIGYDQGGALTALFQKAGYRNTEILKDLSGLDRVALGWKADERREE